MKKRILYLSDLRDWSAFILNGLIKDQKNKNWKIDAILVPPETYFKREKINHLSLSISEIDPKDLSDIISEDIYLKANIILFYGWSYIVPSEIINNKICVCCHPSKLPKYRGGTPIQHQIINGVVDSALTLFQMDKEIDAGPIYKQFPLSLKGHMSEITGRIGSVGLDATIEMLDELSDGDLSPQKQNLSNSKVNIRRKKKENILSYNELANFNSRKLFDFVRALEDPYANAQIKLTDSTLFLKKVALAKPPSDIPLNKIFKINEILGLNKMICESYLVKYPYVVCQDKQTILIKDYQIKD